MRMQNLITSLEFEICIKNFKYLGTFSSILGYFQLFWDILIIINTSWHNSVLLSWIGGNGEPIWIFWTQYLWKSNHKNTISYNIRTCNAEKDESYYIAKGKIRKWWETCQCLDYQQTKHFGDSISIHFNLFH